MSWACSTHGRYDKCTRELSWKYEAKGLLGRTRRRWEKYITIVLVQDVKSWSGFIWLRIRSSGGVLSTRQLTLGSHIRCEYLDQLSDYQFLKGYAPKNSLIIYCSHESPIATSCATLTQSAPYSFNVRHSIHVHVSQVASPFSFPD